MKTLFYKAKIYRQDKYGKLGYRNMCSFLSAIVVKIFLSKIKKTINASKTTVAPVISEDINLINGHGADKKAMLGD